MVFVSENESSSPPKCLFLVFLLLLVVDQLTKATLLQKSLFGQAFDGLQDVGIKKKKKGRQFLGGMVFFNSFFLIAVPFLIFFEEGVCVHSHRADYLSRSC